MADGSGESIVKDLLELNVAIVSGELKGDVQEDADGGDLLSVTELIRKASAAGTMKLEIAGIFSIDGDLLVYKDAEVSTEDKKLFFEALTAGKEYRAAILEALKDATTGLLSLLKQ